MLNGAGVCAGGLLGSALVGHLPGEILGYALFSPFHVLLVLSTAIRFAVHIVFVRTFREVRTVPGISTMGLLVRATHVRAISYLLPGSR